MVISQMKKYVFLKYVLTLLIIKSIIPEVGRPFHRHGVFIRKAAGYSVTRVVLFASTHRVQGRRAWLTNTQYFRWNSRHDSKSGDVFGDNAPSANDG